MGKHSRYFYGSISLTISNIRDVSQSHLNVNVFTLALPQMKSQQKRKTLRPKVEIITVELSHKGISIDRFYNLDKPFKSSYLFANFIAIDSVPLCVGLVQFF